MTLHPPRQSASSSLVPYLVMLATPACFSTNLVFGRFIVDDAAPFLLAAVRWFAVGVILFAIMPRPRRDLIAFARKNWQKLAVMGFLGMGICGGAVYLGLRHTTATNGTLIYTTTPVIILVLEALLKGRRTGVREIIGAILAFAGVGVIVARGDLSTFTSLSFNIGDVLIAAAAFAWATYSLLYKDTDCEAIGPTGLFCLLAFFGSAANMVPAFFELADGGHIPASRDALLAITGIVVISSLLAFSGFQYGVRTLGPSIAGLFMYLLTPFGVLLAVTFLGEQLKSFHMFGIAAVMGGVILATFPARILDRMKST